MPLPRQTDLRLSSLPGIQTRSAKTNGTKAKPSTRSDFGSPIHCCVLSVQTRQDKVVFIHRQIEYTRTKTKNGVYVQPYCRSCNHLWSTRALVPLPPRSAKASKGSSSVFEVPLELPFDDPRSSIASKGLRSPPALDPSDGFRSSSSMGLGRSEVRASSSSIGTRSTSGRVPLERELSVVALKESNSPRCCGDSSPPARPGNA